MLNARTGEVHSSDLEKRCGNRIEDKCPSCSTLYRGDAFQVIRSGLIDAATNLPKAYTMITLTAPGKEVFGETHTRHVSRKGHVQRCACQSYHNEGDSKIGTPIDQTTYDYDAIASFNANASRLFAVTMQKLSRILRRKLQVVRVVEFQARGLVHVHALVLGLVTQRSLEVVVKGGVNLLTGRRIAPASSGGWTWGEQCKAKVYASDNPGKAVAYLVKVVNYAVKDTGHGACKDHSHKQQMAKASARVTKCGVSANLCKHGHKSKTVIVSDLDAATGKAVLRRLTIQFEGRTENWCRRHNRAISGWGFRGHVLTKSRNWGLTFREVRERRLAWTQRSKPQVSPDLIVTWKVLPKELIASSTRGNAPP